MKKYIPIVISLFLASCTKETDSDNTTSEFTVDSVAPAAARVGDTVTLFGTNFTFDLAKARVLIASDSAELIDNTESTIRFVVMKKFNDTTVKLQVGSHEVAEGPVLSYRYIAVVTTIVEGNFDRVWGLALTNNNRLLLADRARKIHTIDLAEATYPVSTIDIETFGFFSPYNLAVDTLDQSVFVTDFNAHILKIDASGKQTVIYNSSEMTTSTGIAVGKDRMLYVSDNVKFKVFKIDQNGGNRSDLATVTLPRNLVFDDAGQLYTINSRVIQIMDNGSVREFPQSKTLGGWQFAIGKGGHFFLAVNRDNKIYKVHRQTGEVTVAAGSGASADIDGVDANAAFDGPLGIVADRSGNLYVSTHNLETGGGKRIRKITFD